VQDGDVAAVKLEGDETMVKRVYREADHLLLGSAHHDYRPQQAGLDVRIIGKVVRSQTDY